MNLRDPRIFARLYAEHAPAAATAASSVLGPAGRRSEVEDVVHDVFLRLWREPARFDADRGSLAAYVRVMARSRAVDLLRHGQAGARASDRVGHAATRRDPVDATVTEAERRAARAALLQAMATLPQPQREAIWLACWGDLTAGEIATREGVPLGTVKGRIRLGLARMRSELETSDVAAGIIAALSSML
ncbi:RNA polymerase sigma-70 factor [Patulibacter medicamentivorans]|uniref:RNA polymerase sigma-70 factor n=1 Tax=Patulibacter medicamentivorans TaxID=1097667 RepID=H0EBF9_9ACTN|nr:sigma-70 family RNA polymerase sigma factor [Patulibacter medicamentivorans]EHN09035.1 RNA polymerase sigma-70 factor [Patulibacter medicamentivorans]